MTMTYSLTQFLHAGEDPRIVLLDIRPHDTHWLPLENVFFPHVELPFGLTSPRLFSMIATTLCGRHVVVVGDSESAAVQVSNELIARDVEASALEGGIVGWLDALVEERVDRYHDMTVAVVRRPALGIATYIVAFDGHVISVNPSGSISVLLAEARRFGPTIDAVVDTAFHRDHVSCGEELASQCDCVYFVPAEGRCRLPYAHCTRVAESDEIGRLALIERFSKTLAVIAPSFTIYDDAGATYPVIDRAWGSDIFDAINRGTHIADRTLVRQLEHDWFEQNDLAR
jgi:hypothetical protein